MIAVTPSIAEIIPKTRAKISLVETMERTVENPSQLCNIRIETSKDMITAGRKTLLVAVTRGHILMRTRDNTSRRLD
jgi:UDP-N-acetylglucosamine enolpyruvyl transferase